MIYLFLRVFWCAVFFAYFSIIFVFFTSSQQKVPEEDKASVREMYKAKHPKAYWVDFGDFSLMRMDTIKAMRFVGGFAMAGDIDPAGKYRSLIELLAEPSDSEVGILFRLFCSDNA